jgi:hypothetical protein
MVYFKLLRQMKNLHQPLWDHEIFYADRSSEMNNFQLCEISGSHSSKYEVLESSKTLNCNFQ